MWETRDHRSGVAVTSISVINAIAIKEVDLI